MKRIDTFIPAEQASRRGILDRWLPPLPPNLVVEYLRAYSNDDDVVWDPFCRGDDAALTILHANRRFLASDYNPLTNFLTRMAVDPVPGRDLNAAFQALRESVRHGASLRDHLMQLYATECPLCQQSAVADYFLWQRKDEQPAKKHVHCPSCRSETLEPVTEADRNRLKAIEPKGFHYWYILERLAPESKQSPAIAERLLGLYTPRNLYALVTLLMRIESVVESERTQDALKVALLHCLLEGSKLAGGQGRSLRVPAQFREANVWQCFEAAMTALRSSADARPPATMTADVETLLTRDETLWGYSAATRRPRALVARRTPRQMAADLPSGSVGLILTRPPYPDRAFLSLAYLWTGWLFGAGPAAVLARLLNQGPFEGWARTLPALRKTFGAMHGALEPEHAMLLFFRTSDADYLTALVMTAVAAGFALDTLLFQRHAATARGKADGDYRLVFVRRPDEEAAPAGWQLLLTPDHLATTLQTAAVRAARQGLQDRGEPMGDDWLQATILVRLGASDEHVLRDVFRLADASTGRAGEQAAHHAEFDALDFVKEQVIQGLKQAVERGTLVVLRDETAPAPVHDLMDTDEGEDEEDRPETKSPAEAGERLWWLAKPTYKPPPLSERVEQAVYNVLSTSLTTTEAAVDRVVTSLYRGLLTPPAHWMGACLASYGRREANGSWSLRADDDRRLRAREHTDLLALLTNLGHRLGFNVWIGRSEQKRKPEGGNPLADLLSARERYVDPEALAGGGKHATEVDVLWYEAGRVHYAFEVEWTAQLTTPVLVRGADRQGSHSFVVLPAARADLVQQRINEAPLLRRALAGGAWDFVKYEHLRTWAAQEAVDLGELGQIAGLQPLVESKGLQLALF